CLRVAAATTAVVFAWGVGGAPVRVCPHRHVVVVEWSGGVGIGGGIQGANEPTALPREPNKTQFLRRGKRACRVGFRCNGTCGKALVLQRIRRPSRASRMPVAWASPEVSPATIASTPAPISAASSDRLRGVGRPPTLALVDT